MNMYFSNMKSISQKCRDLIYNIYIYMMSSRPSNVIDCCSDKALYTKTVIFTKCHTIVKGFVARLLLFNLLLFWGNSAR